MKTLSNITKKIVNALWLVPIFASLICLTVLSIGCGSAADGGDENGGGDKTVTMSLTGETLSDPGSMWAYVVDPGKVVAKIVYTTGNKEICVSPDANTRCEWHTMQTNSAGQYLWPNGNYDVVATAIGSDGKPVQTLPPTTFTVNDGCKGKTFPSQLKRCRYQQVDTISYNPYYDTPLTVTNGTGSCNLRFKIVAVDITFERTVDAVQTPPLVAGDTFTIDFGLGFNLVCSF